MYVTVSLGRLAAVVALRELTARPSLLVVLATRIPLFVEGVFTHD
jgi:hypothetical protein